MTIPWTWIGVGVGAGLLGCVLVGCRSTRPGEGAPPASPLTATDIARGTQSARMEPASLLVRDRGEWEALWSTHSRLQLPPPPAPFVDFDREMVVAVFRGQCPTAGFGVEIVAATAMPATDEAPATVRVEAEATDPEPGAVTAQVITAPFHCVSVPRADGALDLVWRE